MEVSFERHGNELILCYTPAMPERVAYIADKIASGDTANIKKTFCVSKAHVREYEDDNEWDDSIRFCIGTFGTEYIRLFSNVFGTKNSFFISKDIKLKPQMFTAYRDISILSKIDEIIDRDFYIGGNWEDHNGISIEVFQELLRLFPKTTELTLYAHRRISSILREFFPECSQYEAIYDSFIARRRKTVLDIQHSNVEKYNEQIELEQFTVAVHELEVLLNEADIIDEKQWQYRVHGILRLLYPKYIHCEREVRFYGSDKNDKRPDFLLVDTNGFVDILEIKKADVGILTKYRNNYVAARELSGAAQQIEKYVFCLNSSDRAKEDVQKALSGKIPEGVKIQVVNPQGILLLGRSKGMNEQQKKDFEIIKRQYKHIADIMTYDDLLSRLKNIVASLQMRIENE